MATASENSAPAAAGVAAAGSPQKSSRAGAGAAGAVSSPQKSVSPAAGAASGAEELLVGERHLQRRRVRRRGVGPDVVPADEEGDPLLVVDGLHLDRGRRGRERPAGLHDLSDHGEARGRAAPSKSASPREASTSSSSGRRHEEGRVARGVAVAQRVHVVGERPAVRLRHRVVVRRHRGPVEAGAEGAEDVLAAGAAAERPAVGEVRGADRVALVVLQGRGRGALAAPGLAVAAHAAERDVELLPLLDRLLRGRGRRLRARSASGPGRGRRSPGGSP